MTRFARAKGSKASNERREEEATPWHVMRQQLADKLSGTDSKGNETLHNVKSILSKNSSSNEKEVWSDFGEPKVSEVSISNSKSIVRKKNALKHTLEVREMDNFPEDSSNVSHKQSGENLPIAGKNKNIKGKRKLELLDESNAKSCSNKKKKNVNAFKSQRVNESDETLLIDNDCKPCKVIEKNNNVSDHKSKSMKKLNKFKVEISSEIKVTDAQKFNSNNQEVQNPNPNSDVKVNKNVTAKESAKLTQKMSAEVQPKSFKPGKIQINSKFDSRNPTNKNKFQNSRFNNSQAHSIFANDREIKVKPYEGFLVKEEDAKELSLLRKKLKKENIPKEQIKQIMKLERRKAEKSLAREKTKVCFHCRKFGHKLSDCPEVDDKELTRSGMCFKCGSTEHSYFNCKVSQGQDFRHAVCFVCKEQGHISRQCPLNPQGQYPRGGSCHLCGEVTHLRKDCPKAKDEQAGNTANTFISNDLEETKTVNKKSHKKKSIVKF